MAPVEYTIGFGLLAGLAISQARRSENLMPVAVSIGASFAVTNVAWALQFTYQAIQFEDRVALLVLCEALVGSMAMVARMTGGSRLLAWVLTAAVVASMANVTILFTVDPVIEQKHLWNLVINVCYTAECLLIASAGLLERVRQNRRDRRPHHARYLVARNTFRSDK